VSRESTAGVEGLRGLLVIDASGKEIRTPDPFLVKAFASHFKRVRIKVEGIMHTKTGLALVFKVAAMDNEPLKELFREIAEKYRAELRYIVEKAKGMWLEAMYRLRDDINRAAKEAAEVA